MAYASRTEAAALLKTISRCWIGLGVAADDLHHLASLLLCKRNHQWQAEDRVEQWKRKLKEAHRRVVSAHASRALPVTYPTASRASRPSTTTADTETEASRKKRAVRSLSNRRLLKELKKRVDDSADDKLIDDFLALADEVRDAFRADAEREEENSDDDGHDEDGFHNTDNANDDDSDPDDIPNEETATQTHRQLEAGTLLQCQQSHLSRID